jgi:hypothetical protein
VDRTTVTEGLRGLDIASSVEEPSVAPRSERGGFGIWLSDFRIVRGRIQVLATGADIKLDRTLIGEALVWLVYYVVVRLRGWWMALARPNAPRIWFAPHRPRPWYLVWSATVWGGLRFAASPEQADASFAFEDSTWSSPAGPPLSVPAYNFGCPNISKSHVAEVFERIFGYPLALDPLTWLGAAVEKAEVNGTHDGRLVNCPTPPLAGRHYQRLIDTSDGRFVYDLRTPCIGGRPIAVWIKRKPQDQRFSIHNLEVKLCAPHEIFSAGELNNLERFLAEMRIDWAGLDVLRDRQSGLIYVVDVNKTDVGPIIALPWPEKIRSTRLMARALEQMIAQTRAPRRSGAAP